jgi:hypothetical protein
VNRNFYDLSEYEGIRPVGCPRVNKRRLKTFGKDYAELVFFGDWHYGYPTCLIDDIKRMIRICLNENFHVLLMGDLMEAGLPGTPGDVFKQIMPPQEQLEDIIELLRPLASRRLIVGAYRGNHEKRIWRVTGIDPMRVICASLKVPYLGAAMWNLFYVGKQSYKIYALHGSSRARLLWTKIKSAVDIAQDVAPNANVVAMGHVHENTVVERDYMDVSKKHKILIQPKRFIILAGHYVGYDDSYAQEYGMSLGRSGSPRIRLYAKRFDIHASQ